jgi:hypothetical protein
MPAVRNMATIGWMWCTWPWMLADGQATVVHSLWMNKHPGRPAGRRGRAHRRVLHHGQLTTTLKEPTSMRTSEAPVHAAIATMTTMRIGAIQIHVWPGPIF